MKKIRFIGDIHGKWFKYQVVLDQANRDKIKTIQVGDFGFGFNETDQEREFVDRIMGEDHRFIRGNHDDPAVCKEQKSFIRDGHVEDNMMFIGGAHSIDKAWRIPGVSWWEDEELSYEELSDLIEKYEKVKPDVMVTHDGPDSVMRRLFSFYDDPVNKSRTRQAFDTMFQIHKPKYWIFGHWHMTKNENILGTEFICIPELKTFDLEI